MSEVLDLANMVDRLAWLNEQISTYKRDADDLKVLLRRHIGQVKNAHIGEHVLTIQPTLRFNSVLALQRLTSDELILVCVTRADAVRARELLSPARYAECQVEFGEMTVRVT